MILINSMERPNKNSFRQRELILGALLFGLVYAVHAHLAALGARPVHPPESHLVEPEGSVDVRLKAVRGVAVPRVRQVHILFRSQVQRENLASNTWASTKQRQRLYCVKSAEFCQRRLFWVHEVGSENIQKNLVMHLDCLFLCNHALGCELLRPCLDAIFCEIVFVGCIER